MNTRVLLAVFKRNFVGYFANPTGYVFICVFVLLSSIAAFLPYEFFSANLANLDQLNQWFPLIMLVFIPAITMGTWADERRQGTDELLLTIPAGDFDIVCGKYLSAVAIYTVSLLFSLCCNLAILTYLGNPDQGLFFCTYIGYWLIGIAMLAIGMVASFLTPNLTVAYIVGAIFCVPLVALHWVNSAPVSMEAATFLQKFSISDQFESFGRGIVSFSHIAYFFAIIAVMLYLCMVLIGKRHWSSSQQFVGAFHYTVRAISLIVIGFALTMIFERYDLRADMTEEKLSTLSPLTVGLIQNLDSEHPVVIEAYLSPDVPDSFVQTRMNIISILKEFQSRSDGKISVRFHDTIRPNTEESLIAAERYGITPREIWYESRGTRNNALIFMGVAFRSGLRSITLPFVNRGLSPEYELVHALCSVTDPQKKRIGILKTDVPLFGQFSMQTFSQSPEMRIVEELKKRYIVVEVDPAIPRFDRFDALVAVQPSSLGPSEMQNFINAVRQGQPTVIFEDSFPIDFIRTVGGTNEPRRQQNQFMMQQQVPPKGDISMLWAFLGVDFDGFNSVWQAYNPIRKLESLPQGYVFLDKTKDENSGEIVSPFEKSSPIMNQLQYLLIPFPGSIRKSVHSQFDYQPLAWTIYKPSGLMSVQKARSALQQNYQGETSIEETLNRLNQTTVGSKELAARITGEYMLPAPAPSGEEGEKQQPPQPVKIDVILVADIDLLHDRLFLMQESGSPPGMGINLDFDNVPFVLNMIDAVAGDERFLEIRTRRPIHRTLQRIDKATDEMWEKTIAQREASQKELENAIETETQKLTSRLEKIQNDMRSQGLPQTEVQARYQAALISATKNMTATNDKMRREVNDNIEAAKIKLNEYIQKTQGYYKFYAVALPPIPPLLIGLCVFISRKIREYEGVPKSRRRK